MFAIARSPHRAARACPARIRASRLPAAGARQRRSRTVPNCAPYCADDAALSPRAAGHFDLAAVIGETVFHVDDDGAAQRVEPIDRIGADDRDAVDGDVGNQVPVQRVAESLVDAHAVLIDGKTFRRAQHGRRLEAAEQNVGLKRVVEIVIDVDAAELIVERRNGARRAFAREVGGGDGLRHCRRTLSISMPVPGKRSRADDGDGFDA